MIGKYVECTVHVWVVSTYSTEKYCDKMHTQKVKTKKLKL